MTDGTKVEKVVIIGSGPAGGGESKILTAALDRAVNGPFSWSADGKSLTFTVSVIGVEAE